MKFLKSFSKIKNFSISKLDRSFIVVVLYIVLYGSTSITGQSVSSDCGADRGDKFTCYLDNQVTKSADVIISNKKNEKVDMMFMNGLEFKNLPVNTAKVFPNLKRMAMTRCPVESLTRKNFQNLKRLEEISFPSNSISSLEKGLFDDLASIRKIDLYDNQITSLPANVFYKLLKLEYLDISFNNLTALDVETFKNNRKLEDLYIQSNFIAHIETGMYDNLKLHSLDDSDNPRKL